MSAGAAAIAAAAATADATAATSATGDVKTPMPTTQTLTDGDGGWYLTQDTAAKSGRVGLWFDPRTSQMYARPGPRGMPAYSLQRRFVAKHSGGERIGVEQPYEAMPNTQTARQWANIIAQAIVTLQSRVQHRPRCRVIDVGYNMSSTVAALLFHPIHETLLSPAQVSYSLALDFYGTLRDVAIDPGSLTAVRFAALNAELRDLENLATALQVDAARDVVAKLRLAVDAAGAALSSSSSSSLAAAETVPSIGEALAALTRYESTSLNVGVGDDDSKGDDGFWARAFARAAVRSCIRDAPVDFPGNSQLGAEFLSRFQASAAASGTTADDSYVMQDLFRRFPAFPSTEMLKGANVKSRVTVFNFTLFHDPRQSLFDAVMECLCLRLLFCAANADEPGGTGATVMFVNDFMGRLFVDDAITSSDGGFDGTEATSPLTQPPMYLRNDLSRDKIHELVVAAAAFGLPKLSAATRRMAEQKTADPGQRSRHRVESWTAIRHAVLTAPLNGTTNLFRACVRWMTTIRGAKTEQDAAQLDVSSSAALSFVTPRHAYATHANGLQLVRLSHPAAFKGDGDDAMQKMLYSPLGSVTIGDARRLDPSVPAWIIGNTPRDDENKTAAAASLVPGEGGLGLAKRLEVVVGRRAAWAPSDSAAVIRATGNKAIRDVLNGIGPVAARGIVASQPSYRNAVLAWCILDQMSGGRDPAYKTALVINDWLGVFAQVIQAGARQRRVLLADLAAVSASEQAVVGRLSPADTLLSMNELRADETSPNRGVLPVLLNLNWGTPRRDGASRWPDLLDMCTRAGRLVHQLVSSTMPAVLCMFLPGRPIHEGHTSKTVIGDQHVPVDMLPVKDSNVGEVRPAYFGSPQWVLTQTILTQAALRIRAADHFLKGDSKSQSPSPSSQSEFNIDDYVWIAHQPITPTLALLCVRTWPRLRGRPVRSTLPQEWARFVADLAVAYATAAEQYSLFAPRVEREHYIEAHPAAETAAEKQTTAK